MYTDLEICNLGLGKISSSRVSVIAPPRSPLEVYVSAGYPVWRRTELTKRRWVFALVDDYIMTLSGTATADTVDSKPYKFDLPSDCLRPVRLRRTEWKQRGRALYSAYDALTIQYIRNVDETEFDPLFVDVLSNRIAVECCEFVTQSNTKKESARQGYLEAVTEAKKLNAFVIGPEDIGADDEDFSFLTARYT
jgi:hypothetical protein